MAMQDSLKIKDVRDDEGMMPRIHLKDTHHCAQSVVRVITKLGIKENTCAYFALIRVSRVLK
jgi:hypothetical protein